MSPGSHFIGDLATVLGVGAITSVAARAARQPAILGYLLAGLIVGPYLPIPIFADQERVAAMAEFGVVLVMFSIGLEFRIAKLMRVLPVSGFTGVVQIGFLLWCGTSLGTALGWNPVEALFLGASIAISSTMVVSSVFKQLPVKPGVREHVLAILVLQDVVAIALIAAMTAVAAGGGLEPAALATTLGGLAVTLVGMLGIGMLVVPPMVRAVARLDSPETMTVAVTGLCFAMALLAEQLGYSVALGAFIAGILVAESGKGQETEHLIGPVRDMFAAIFFVSIGMAVDPRQAWAHLPTSLIVFGVVVVAQLSSVSLAGVLSGVGLRRSMVAGFALGQIGEFAFIIGGIGIAAGVARPELQPILVTVAMLTAFTTPQLLRVAEPIVGIVDRAMPKPVQHFIALYSEWFERLRSDNDEEQPPLRRAVNAIAFDGGALIALATVAALTIEGGQQRVASYFGLDEGDARLAVVALVLLVAAPLAVGLVRNTLALGRLAVLIVAPRATDRPGGAGRLLRLMMYTLVLVGVGVPGMAVLRPLVGGLYGALVLFAFVAAGALSLWWRREDFEAQIRSGAEQIAEALAQDAEDQESVDTHTLSDPNLIPGLDAVRRIVIAEGREAVGRSLAQLNVRALTGATVVAIYRAGNRVVLPTGREILEPGDALAVTGTHVALEAAAALLAS